ncbi:release factor glutamine methyltransferase [Methylohalomonas lacus]|uniref:Release factor glutamine methyltransferase n=1 Tax=Methylohalomonas lacus TaxID=398773 RepID=A0AAE3L087_9GAMM|nr:peptide chain release factor N(5)-glutamine methyltransferase [Methylohalomonas lacus]MCS3902079.1 release factor glutamine methyltransferase [Methylohalomonas lacus]
MTTSTLDLSIRALLERAGSRVPTRLDAELLLAHVLGETRSSLYAHPQRRLQPQQAAAFEQLLARRSNGEPLAYLTGEREFWSLALTVTPATLVPRPETELLVERALALMPTEAAVCVADLGTGSGAIAIALARERPHAHISATDSSAAALAVARDNARRHDCGHIVFRQGDWLEALADERCDLIVANPPYVAAGDPALAGDGVRFEPRGALAAGSDGLDDLRTIIATAGRHLNAGGWLLLEHGHDQATAVSTLLQQHGFERIDCWHDAAGQPRVSGGRHDH